MAAFDTNAFGLAFDTVVVSSSVSGAFDASSFNSAFNGGVDTSTTTPVVPVIPVPSTKFIFDPVNKLIIMNTGVTSFTAQELYMAWKVWAQTNSQYLQAMAPVGADPIGGGLYVAAYFFLLNGWRLRPFESNHTLTIFGNLFVDGGTADPVVPTLGLYQVLVKTVVPMQAQGINVTGTTSGSGTGTYPTVDQIAQAVWSMQTSQMTTQGSIGKWLTSKVLTVSKFLGLK
jgi:hypothetical protein